MKTIMLIFSSWLIFPLQLALAQNNTAYDLGIVGDEYTKVVRPFSNLSLYSSYFTDDDVLDALNKGTVLKFLRPISFSANSDIVLIADGKVYNQISETMKQEFMTENYADYDAIGKIFPEIGNWCILQISEKTKMGAQAVSLKAGSALMFDAGIVTYRRYTSDTRKIEFGDDGGITSSDHGPGFDRLWSQWWALIEKGRHEDIYGRTVTLSGELTKIYGSSIFVSNPEIKDFVCYGINKKPTIGEVARVVFKGLANILVPTAKEIELQNNDSIQGAQ